MIPVRLALSNFMSYAANASEIDFTPLRMACLSGENGHGKSALLDAMTWALWGEARAPADALVRQGQSTMYVDFQFEVDGQRYRVMRTRVYGKGTKDMPRCGFTLETIQFFDRFGYPFEVVDVLEDMRKREELSEITNWPTLPKIFINGKFYGDTDILGPMAESGELQKILEETFGQAVQPKTTINLH